MPNLRRHCEHCKTIYGYDFEEIHKWMDEISGIAMQQHRMYRHDVFNTPKEAKKIFWDLIPAEQRLNIENAVLDHLQLDKEEGEKLTLQSPRGKKGMHYVAGHLQRILYQCDRIDRFINEKEPMYQKNYFLRTIKYHLKNSVKHYLYDEKIDWADELQQLINKSDIEIDSIWNSLKKNKPLRDQKIRAKLIEINEKVKEIVMEARDNIEYSDKNEKAIVKSIAESSSLKEIFFTAKELKDEEKSRKTKK